ncbi:MAG: HAD family hydrolase [Clostridia bacterium]|nr:HAD family hydrolase [Clostridia bacterium]
MIRAILFDFDGTIADSIDAICAGVNQVMESRGFPLHDYNDVLGFINHGPRELMRKALPEEYRADEAYLDGAYAEYNEAYGNVYHITNRAYDGICELVTQLHEEGYLIGVLSNKQDSFVRLLTEQILPKGTWDFSVGCMDGKPTKPHPYLTELIMQKLGVTASECIMIGDSDVDIKTGKNAHMPVISVTWGFRDENFLIENGAQYLAHTPQELGKIIRQIASENV